MTELAPILDKLAAQFGTTTTYLWGVMIGMSKAYAWSSAIQAGIGILVLILLIYGMVKMWKWAVEDEECGAALCLSALLILIMALDCTLIINNIRDAILGFTYPEGWALNNILYMIKSGK